MRFFTVFLAATVFAGSGFAQTTADYLKLRVQQHIVQPTPAAKLEQIVGQSVVEVQGVVQGLMSAGTDPQYLIELDDKSSLLVECQGAPEWLNNGEVPVRMLLHLSRSAQYGELVAKMISVAPEADLAKVDAAYWKAEAEKAKEKTKVQSSRAQPLASRGGGGGVEMYGWIGRAGRGHRAPAPAFSVQRAYRDFVLKRNPRIGYEAADEIAHHVIRFSLGYAVDARLVMALIMAESDFRPLSTSGPGAMGLGQLMPGTASWMGITNPYDLEQNLYATIKLLRHHMSEYHVDQYPEGSEGYYQALGIVLAAYNAGEGAVRKYGGIPPYRETQNYVARVIGTYKRLRG